MFIGASAVVSAAAPSSGVALLLQPASISIAALNGASQSALVFNDDVIDIVMFAIPSFFNQKIIDQSSLAQDVPAHRYYGFR
jgi:hypothetical protein